MSEKKVHEVEAELIYLLLHYKSLVGDFVESGVSPSYFSDRYQFLLKCILNVYHDDGVRLTKEAYKKYLKELKSPKQRISEEMKFGECYISRTERDNFPGLLDDLNERHLESAAKKALRK